MCRWSAWAILAVGVLFAHAIPVMAENPPDNSYKPASADELLHEDPSSRLNGWHPDGAGGYAAQQIVDNARLSHQLTPSAEPDNDLLNGGSVLKKRKHMSTTVFAVLVATGVLLSSLLVLFVWTRIVNWRETRDNRSPINFPRV
jgi:hypothetical protein